MTLSGQPPRLRAFHGREGLRAVSEDSADCVLAADIGGTHARLGMFSEREGRLQADCLQKFRVADYEEPDELIGAFIDSCEHKPGAACLGVAGPVLAGRCRLTNQDWVLESEFLAQQLGLQRVELINDLEAMALGLDDLSPGSRLALQKGRPQGNQRIGLLAVGTGLGEALRFNQDGRVSVVAGEGGHADFAPANERDWALRGFLAERHGGRSGQTDQFVHGFPPVGVNARPFWVILVLISVTLNAGFVSIKV